MYVYLQGIIIVSNTYSNTTTAITNTRSICQEYGFVNNARVVVVKLFSNSICVRTLDDKCKELTLPRIKFRFRVAYGKSFVMIRNQFPLKLGNSFIIITISTNL